VLRVFVEKLVAEDSALRPLHNPVHFTIIM